MSSLTLIGLSQLGCVQLYDLWPCITGRLATVGILPSQSQVAICATKTKLQCNTHTWAHTPHFSPSRYSCSDTSLDIQTHIDQTHNASQEDLLKYTTHNNVYSTWSVSPFILHPEPSHLPHLFINTQGVEIVFVCHPTMWLETAQFWLRRHTVFAEILSHS